MIEGVREWATVDFTDATDSRSNVWGIDGGFDVTMSWVKGVDGLEGIWPEMGDEDSDCKGEICGFKFNGGAWGIVVTESSVIGGDDFEIDGWFLIVVENSVIDVDFDGVDMTDEAFELSVGACGIEGFFVAVNWVIVDAFDDYMQQKKSFLS